MRSLKFYGMIVKIKNKITLLTLLTKNLIYSPQNLVYHFLQSIVNIFLYYSCLYKKTILKGFLHYIQVYLLFNIDLMHPEAESGRQDILVPPKLKNN